MPKLLGGGVLAAPLRSLALKLKLLAGRGASARHLIGPYCMVVGR